MADWVYPYGTLQAFQGNIDLLTDTIKLALFTTSYTPAQGDNTYTGTNEVANGNGYTTGGKTLSNKTWTEATATETRFDNTVDADTEWTSASFSARYGEIYVDGVTDYLLVQLDFVSEKTASGGTFAVVFNANGIFGITH